MVSFTAQWPDGRVTEPFGGRPVGRIIYEADGRVTALLMHERRNEADGHRSPPEVQAGFTAYFGTYRTDEERSIVTHSVTASLSAARASGEFQRHYKIHGDTLTLTFTREQGGLPVTNSLVWRRVSSPDRQRTAG
ncbi:MAG: lipocalin-like domain-containing protein [Meiothermus sp.]|nr:lipocalin-like domain-containing protein [Meiothermus sp.]